MGRWRAHGGVRAGAHEDVAVRLEAFPQRHLAAADFLPRLVLAIVTTPLRPIGGDWRNRERLAADGLDAAGRNVEVDAVGLVVDVAWHSGEKGTLHTVSVQGARLLGMRAVVVIVQGVTCANKQVKRCAILGPGWGMAVQKGWMHRSHL